MDYLDLEQECAALESLIKEKKTQIAALKQTIEILKQGRKDETSPDSSRTGSAVSLLPDEVLLRIFKNLDPTSLLQVVDVCQTWRRVSRNVDLWRYTSVHLYSASRDSFAVARTLCKAPIVVSLHVSVDALLKCRPSVRDVVVYYSCPVLNLTINASRMHVYALLLLTRQAPFLTFLSLIGGRLGSDADELWHAIQSTRLTTLEIRDYHPKRPTLLGSSFRIDPKKWRSSSLESLVLYSSNSSSSSSERSGSVVESLLSVCATEHLKEVVLPHKCTGRVVAKLAKCANLGSAAVPAVKEVAALKGCARLSTLKLHVLAEHGGSTDLQEVVDYVLNVETLTDFSLNLENLSDVSQCRDVLDAVARSKSVLEELTLTLNGPAAWATVKDVMRAQSRLCELSLQGRELPAELLDAVIPDIAPKLRILNLSVMCECDTDDQCLLPAIDRLRGRNPQIEWVDDVDCQRKMSDSEGSEEDEKCDEEEAASSEAAEGSDGDQMEQESGEGKEDSSSDGD